VVVVLVVVLVVVVVVVVVVVAAASAAAAAGGGGGGGTAGALVVKVLVPLWAGVLRSWSELYLRRSCRSFCPCASVCRPSVRQSVCC
jgi:hypothetical protein